MKRKRLRNGGNMETLTKVLLIPVKYYLPTKGASNENHCPVCLHVKWVVLKWGTVGVSFLCLAWEFWGYHFVPETTVWSWLAVLVERGYLRFTIPQNPNEKIDIWEDFAYSPSLLEILQSLLLKLAFHLNKDCSIFAFLGFNTICFAIGGPTQFGRVTWVNVRYSYEL